MKMLVRFARHCTGDNRPGDWPVESWEVSDDYSVAPDDDRVLMTLEEYRNHKENHHESYLVWRHKNHLVDKHAGAQVLAVKKMPFFQRWLARLVRVISIRKWWNRRFDRKLLKTPAKLK